MSRAGSRGERRERFGVEFGLGGERVVGRYRLGSVVGGFAARRVALGGLARSRAPRGLAGFAL
ncbi:MAG: hypothetical protein KF901_29720, partial [Myxococcales bacterium]|nr:hypothetical protein [Myxococcales bacterium]